jgi:branched-chain amino acid transport system substrate-binding protein
LAGAAVVVAALAIAGCSSSGSSGSSGGSSNSSSNSPIKVGTLESTSGILATYGIPEKQAIELAVNQVNATGGIDGHKLVWTFLDPAGDTATGVSMTHQLIQQDGVQVIVGGGTSSGIALAMDPIVTAAHVFFASGEADPGIVAPPSAHPITFQTTLSSQSVVDRMLATLQAQHVTKIAFLADSSAYGLSGLQAAEGAAKSYGIQVDGISYDPAATDLTAQLLSASKSNPQAYLNWTATPTGVIFMKNAQSLGLDKKAIVMEGFTYSSAGLMQEAGSAGDGVMVAASKVSVMNSLLASDPQQATLAAFSKAFEAAYHTPITIYAAEAYDAAEVAITALRRTGGDPDAQKMAAAMTSMPFVGVLGTFGYSAATHYGLTVNDVVMTKWNGSSFVLQNS